MRWFSLAYPAEHNLSGSLLLLSINHMCGIVAFFSRQKPISVQPLKSAPESLRHRGPDARGAWVSSNRRVALGHTRLSIIDLETGDQPITNETGRIHIIANGEFYDFERQRSELESLGHVFRTRSDSEIALHLFEEFGTHCVQKLRGEFAFVLWDDLNQMLFAARDRFGIKTLYCAVYDDTIYLASEIKALFAECPRGGTTSVSINTLQDPLCPTAPCSRVCIKCLPVIVSRRR